MKVIFTCGGTAGHVNPALALAGYMREKDAGTQILFVGAERGLERDLIAHTDYPFRTVNISSFHRSFRPAEIKHNLVSLKNLAHAEREANAILHDFHPDLIVGTAGTSIAGMLCEGRFALYLAGEPYKSGLKAQGCGKLKKAVFSIELDEDEEAE